MKQHPLQWTRRTFLGGMAVGGTGALLGLSPRRAAAQGTFTLVDTESVPGPGDNMVVVERPNHTVVASIGFSTNEVVSHRVEADSTLTTIGTATVGSGPRAGAMARNGQYAVIANSGSDDLSVMAVLDSGLLDEIGRYSSLGISPFDVAVAYEDYVVVTNRGSNSVVVLSIDRRGVLHPITAEPAGIDPHVIAVGPSGVVAVANSTSNDLTIFDLHPRGTIRLIDDAFPVGDSPKALTFGSHELFVGTRSTTPGVEDQIQAYRLRPGGGLEAAGSTDGGIFLTALAATHDTLFAATVTAAGQDQLLAYGRHQTDLVLHATIEPAGPPPSFKQLSTAPGRDGVDQVFMSEFQGGRLRTFKYFPPE